MRRSNWLLRCLVGVSLGIHLVIFSHITQLYTSQAMSYIELTLKDATTPPKRSIPRPRYRPEMPDKPQDIQRMQVTERPIPVMKPIKAETAERDLPDSLVERISMPDIPQDPGLHITEWVPSEEVGADSNYVTPTSYLEMVRLQIEQHKRYPLPARAKNIEGRVAIRFIITPEGEVKNVEISKGSRHTILNGAALKAVTDAAPFPKPPGQELFLEITIVFELT